MLAAMSVLWGVPYLFIRIAVDSYSPPAIVAGRTLLAAVLLLPFALRRGALRAAWRHWPWVLAFGLVEMGGPFLLLGHAEQSLPSGPTGLLVATVPLFAALIALTGGDRTVLQPARIAGLVIGFLGVAAVVAGPGLFGGEINFVAVGEVLLVAVLYSIAPFIVARKLGDVPSMGTVTLAMLFIGTLYLPIALATQHEVPTPTATVAVVVLGVVCTAVAFLVFFALIREVGPVRAPLFTYVNPVVALLLGALVLAEPLSPGLAIGFPLIVVGCWFAGTGGRIRRSDAEDLTPVDESVAAASVGATGEACAATAIVEPEAVTGTVRIADPGTDAPPTADD
nr:EamA family transporter [Microbacterium pseudoresistens]